MGSRRWPPAFDRRLTLSCHFAYNNNKIMPQHRLFGVLLAIPTPIQLFASSLGPTACSYGPFRGLYRYERTANTRYRPKRIFLPWVAIDAENQAVVRPTSRHHAGTSDPCDRLDPDGGRVHAGPTA